MNAVSDQKRLGLGSPTVNTRLTMVRRLMTPSTRPRLSSTGATLAPNVTVESITRYPASLPPEFDATVALASVPPRAIMLGSVP
jgi:hypothetical protein